MTISYSFDTDRSLILTKVEGILTVEDTLRYFEVLRSDPSCPDRAIEIVDFSEVSDFVIQYSEMRSITSRYQPTKSSKRIVATVFHCTSDLSYGIGRTLMALHEGTNPKHAVHVVRSNDELQKLLEKLTI